MVEPSSRAEFSQVGARGNTSAQEPRVDREASVASSTLIPFCSALLTETAIPSGSLRRIHHHGPTRLVLNRKRCHLALAVGTTGSFRFLGIAIVVAFCVGAVRAYIIASGRDVRHFARRDAEQLVAMSKTSFTPRVAPTAEVPAPI